MHSVSQKSIELFDYLVTENIDIALISESWLKPDISFNHPNFIIYRNDRLTRGGGVAIIVKKNVKHSLLPSIGTKVIETISISIPNDISEIILIAAYFPGKRVTNDVLNSFKKRY